MGKFLNNQKGQSAVEYILLLAVIVIFVVGVIRSPPFQSMFGPRSALFTQYKRYLEFSYRHTHLDMEQDPLSDYEDYSGDHRSFVHNNNGDTRFFLVSEEYGGE